MSVRKKFATSLKGLTHVLSANVFILHLHTHTHIMCVVGRATLITSLNKRCRGHLFLAKTSYNVIKLSHDYYFLLLLFEEIIINNY